MSWWFERASEKYVRGRTFIWLTRLVRHDIVAWCHCSLMSCLANPAANVLPLTHFSLARSNHQATMSCLVNPAANVLPLTHFSLARSNHQATMSCLVNPAANVLPLTHFSLARSNHQTTLPLWSNSEARSAESLEAQSAESLSDVAPKARAGESESRSGFF